ncbi:MAG: GTPase HflX [Pseudomonadota bacterium]
METETLINIENTFRKAVIVGMQIDEQEYEIIQDLNELEALLRTLGIATVGRMIQKRVRPTASHLIGTGKAEEVKALCDQEGAGLVVIDHVLSGPQIRNLESDIKRQVVDRSGVILDIFARHAKTNAAKTQVKIAQLEYLMPRLVGLWTHFGRQSGSGAGEKQIEMDRRKNRDRIGKLKKRLEEIEGERKVQRRSRRNEIKVAVVGYTNSGKTTLMKGLTSADTDGKDELFATLVASTRPIDPNTRPKILLSDTVGFIRKLPHGLIESFKSTLEEVLDADLLLHVVDVSHTSYNSQMETTAEVLKEIGADHIPTILAFNKMDQVDDPFLPRILKKKYSGSICLSAHSSDDIKRLRNHIFEYFEDKFHEACVLVRPDERDVLSLVHQKCIIIDANYEVEGEIRFHIRAPEIILSKLKKSDSHGGKS